MTKVPLKQRILIGIVSLMMSLLLYMSVSIGESGTKGKELSLLSNTKGVYVIDNLKIDYLYDKTKYEVVPLVNEPYAVVKGDKRLINILKMTGHPRFYIDLNGKLTGKYQEKVNYEGIPEGLDVEIYPSIIDLRIMEQQTLRVKPVIELIGVEEMDSRYVVSVPEVQVDEVRIRDMQDKLNQVGQVKGFVDVSNMKKSEVVRVPLKVYDRDGKVMKNINLIDKWVDVKIPIEKKVTIIKEEVVKKIVVENKEDNKSGNTSPVNNNTKEVKKEPTVPNKEPVKRNPPNNEVPKETPVKTKGELIFKNIGEGLMVEDKSGDIGLTRDIVIDVKGFKAGVYQMEILDGGKKKKIVFEIKEKSEETTSPTNTEESNDKENK